MFPAPAACSVCDAPLSPHQRQTGRVCDRSACRRAYLAAPPGHKCRVCGRLLAGPQVAAGVCADPECRGKVLQQETAERAEEARRRQAALEADAERVRDRTAGVADPRTYPVVVVPAFGTRLLPVPDERRAALVKHLDRVLAEALGDATGPIPTPPATPPAELLPVIGRACGSCRGWCCQTGRNHAYLEAKTIRRVRAADPDRPTDELRAAYLAAVGGESVEGSCVYHGPRGCGLPRELRSDVCNRFFCDPLVAFLGRPPSAEPVRAFVATADGGLKSAAFVDETGERVVDVSEGCNGERGA